MPNDGAAAGWTVVVRGYADYIYRERPVPGNYDRRGTASAPVVFTAEGWTPGATDYAKPIVSGAKVARSLASRGKPTRQACGRPPGARSHPGFDRAKPYSSAIFQNRTGSLWQHASLADLRNRASRGDGGYWWDSGATGYTWPRAVAWHPDR